MSIWASWDHIGTDPDGYAPHRGDVRSYALGWSNHYPSEDVERPASIDVAHIPSWCVPGHRDDEDFETVGPWLRLGICSWEHDYLHPRTQPIKRTALDVVMDEAAVRALAADLTEWLDRPKTHPTSAPEETP